MEEGVENKREPKANVAGSWTVAKALHFSLLVASSLLIGTVASSLLIGTVASSLPIGTTTNSLPNSTAANSLPSCTAANSSPNGVTTWRKPLDNPPGWFVNYSIDKDHKVSYSLIDNEGYILRRRGNNHILDELVDDKAVPEYKSGIQPPLPCVSVDNDIAVLKSHREDNDYLVIPILKITGVEDRRLIESKTPNYFAEAFDTNITDRVKKLALERETIDLIKSGLHKDDAAKTARQDVDKQIISATLNSAAGRSQDRLHIHDDFVLSEVQLKLKEQLDAGKIVTGKFQNVGELVNGHSYRAMWVDADIAGGLGKTNPVKLVHDQLPQDKQDTMDLQTIAVVPETKVDTHKGFIILAGTAEPATGGGTSHGEELQHKNSEP